MLPDDAEKVLPCRPTIACTADVVPAGRLELETGAVYRRLTGVTQRASPTLLKLSLLDSAQLQLGTNGYTANQGAASARYLDDLTVGGKLVLALQTELRPALGVSATLSVPTFVGQTGYVRTYDGFFTGYVTKDLGPLHVDLNLGLNVWRLEEAPRPQAFFALALSALVVAPFGVLAELYMFGGAAPVAPRDGGLLFGVTHAPKPWLMFDAGGDVSVFPSTRAFSVFIGATVIPAVLWK